jgi:gliding motility-associated-like protein
MLLKKLPILIFLFFASGNLYAQSPCTTLGQNPETAFPVCGTDTFHQGTVPYCGGTTVPCPFCPNGFLYTDKNPFWYKFTCFTSGKLAFFITPNNTFTEDYDWQLFDVTGRLPADVYTDPSLIVACNWSAEYGITGASDALGGTSLYECDGPGVNLISKMPDLIAGHNYLLLISHFSDTPNGYGLSFGGVGNTAVITDTLSPHLNNANTATCDGSQILVTLNKKMKCSSVAADGSDFIINPPAATIISAVGLGCSNSFDMDSVLITFNQPLPFNNYNLIVQTGTDGNTLLDICKNGIPVGESIPFTVLSPLPVPMDSIMTNKCYTDSLELVFRRSLKCSSVAPDGSDFFVTGTYPVTITGATAVNCNNGLTKRIVIHIASSMQVPGNFQLRLRVGTDGNTLLSECDSATPAGSMLPFSVLPKPVPDFLIPASVCLPHATVIFINTSSIADGTENAFRYLWDFGDPASGANNSSTAKTPAHLYAAIGPFNVNLRVTSGAGCTSDTTKILNTIHPQPKAYFGFNKAAICLGDPLTFTDSTNAMDGITIQWNWNLGDGSPLQHVPVFSYTYGAEQTYTISLYTMNNHGCFSDTFFRNITVYPYPTVNAGPDRLVLEGAYLQLQSVATGNDLQYLWTPALYLNDPLIPNPRVIAIKGDMLYTLTVTSRGGCLASDQLFIKVLKMPRIPNTFTPNNDGINDLWEIQYLEDYPENHLQVFTRTGQLVFESKGYYKPWNGTYKGKPLPVDTYYYIIEPGSGRDPITGYVQLIK